MAKYLYLRTLMWAYISELLLATCVSVFIWLIVPSDTLPLLIADSIGVLSTVLIACIALSGSGLYSFYSTSNKNLGVWLHKHNSYGVYAFAFMYTMVIFLVTVLVLQLTRHHSTKRTLVAANLYLLSYSAILFLTFLNNYYNFSRLAVKFYEIKEQSNERNHEET